MKPETSPRIAIVTDSAVDLPQRYIDQFGIHVVPQVIRFGKRSFLDGLEIDTEMFYDMLRTAPEHPSTANPPVSALLELYHELAPTVDGIVSIHISNELSGTMNSATTAATNAPNSSIEIIDSRGASMMVGFPTLAAARAVAQGGDLFAAAEAARAAIAKMHVYFVVDTLEYLHRGGRIGAASKLIGSALNLKPVLTIHDGRVEPVARVRTQRKALDKVYELIAGDLKESDQVHMATLHADAPALAQKLTAELCQRFQPVEMIETHCGPLIGTHAGPGTVGVVFYTE